jgi:Txe/YoeB family toxin of Txe-Axe toxin-antitoxin module
MLQENLNLIVNKANKIFKNTEEVERQHSQMQEKIQEIIHSNNNNKEEKIIKAYEDMQKLINI